MQNKNIKFIKSIIITIIFTLILQEMYRTYSKLYDSGNEQSTKAIKEFLLKKSKTFKKMYEKEISQDTSMHFVIDGGEYTGYFTLLGLLNSRYYSDKVKYPKFVCFFKKLDADLVKILVYQSLSDPNHQGYGDVRSVGKYYTAILKFTSNSFTIELIEEGGGII